MRQPNIQTRLLMKVVPLNVEPKRWGNNANMVTLVDLQQNPYMEEQRWICCSKYLVHKFEEIRHVNE